MLLHDNVTNLHGQMMQKDEVMRTRKCQKIVSGIKIILMTRIVQNGLHAIIALYRKMQRGIHLGVLGMRKLQKGGLLL